MKQKTLIVVIAVITVIITIVGVVFLVKNNVLEKDTIEIIDATYSCGKYNEKFYEDNEYVYYFPCAKSESVYVKFPNGNKMLVVRALEENKVTIQELLKAGLEVIKEQK